MNQNTDKCKMMDNKNTIKISRQRADGSEETTVTISVDEMIKKILKNKVSREHYLRNKQMWDTCPSVALFQMILDKADPAQNRNE